MALRERRLTREVVGIGRNKANLAKAQQLGAIDRFETDIAKGVGDADLVVVCTPVDTIAEFVRQIGVTCRKDTLITDAGSTKEEIVSAVDGLTPNGKSGPHFVGSHPLAGDHRTGVEVARGDLLDGRKVIVTPTAKSEPATVAKLSKFWRSLGAEVRTMTPAAHDAALAATSHLPHLVATRQCGDRFSPQTASTFSQRSTDSKARWANFARHSPREMRIGCCKSSNRHGR